MTRSTPTPMTEARLREIYGPVSPRAAVKVIDRLDRHCRAFIAASPLVVLGTASGGTIDLSPKGDPAGFVVVEDDRSLLLPDRPGNNRLDGLLNVLRDPAVSLLFLIPTVDETLRVQGRAEITEDAALRTRTAMNGRLPRTVLRIAVARAFIHCGKAFMRAGLWTPGTWPEARPLATLGEMVGDHSGVRSGPVDQAGVEDSYRSTLY